MNPPPSKRKNLLRSLGTSDHPAAATPSWSSRQLFRQTCKQIFLCCCPSSPPKCAFYLSIFDPSFSTTDELIVPEKRELSVISIVIGWNWPVLDLKIASLQVQKVCFEIFPDLVQEQLISIPPRLTGKRFWYDIVLLLFYPYISNWTTIAQHKEGADLTSQWLFRYWRNCASYPASSDGKVRGIGLKNGGDRFVAEVVVRPRHKGHHPAFQKVNFRCTYLHILGLNHINWSHTFQQTIPSILFSLHRHRACLDLLPENILFDIIYEIFERYWPF